MITSIRQLTTTTGNTHFRLRALETTRRAPNSSRHEQRADYGNSPIPNSVVSPTQHEIDTVVSRLTRFPDFLLREMAVYATPETPKPGGTSTPRGLVHTFGESYRSHPGVDTPRSGAITLPTFSLPFRKDSVATPDPLRKAVTDKRSQSANRPAASPSLNPLPRYGSSLARTLATRQVTQATQYDSCATNICGRRKQEKCRKNVGGIEGEHRLSIQFKQRPIPASQSSLRLVRSRPPARSVMNQRSERGRVLGSRVQQVPRRGTAL